MGQAYPFDEVCWGLGKGAELGDMVFDLPDGSAYGLAVDFDNRVIEMSEMMPSKYHLSILGLAQKHDMTLEMTLWRNHGEY